MYDIMRLEFCWIHEANDVYNTVLKCISCTRYHQTNKKERKLLLFFQASPLNFVAIDMLGHSANTESRNTYILVIKRPYSRLIKVIPTMKTTATRTANIFMGHWVANFIVLFTVLTDNGPNSAPNVFPHSAKN